MAYNDMSRDTREFCATARAVFCITRIRVVTYHYPENIHFM